MPVHLVVQGSVFPHTAYWPILVGNEAGCFFGTIHCCRHPVEFVLRSVYCLLHHIAEPTLSKSLVPVGIALDFVMVIALRGLALVRFGGHTAFRVHNGPLAERRHL